MTSPSSIVVVLGSGGTIAGRAAQAGDVVGYRAGELSVQALLQAVPALASQRLEAEQVAQIDSKDMAPAVWQALARRAAHHLARPEVAGVVVTHGTDTLEETAWLLHRVLAPAGKPLVLTAAMRPASSIQADGPQNLVDAVTLARTEGACGVVVVIGGAVWAAGDLRKVHTLRLDAFAGGDAGPIARLDGGPLRRFRDWPRAASLGLEAIARDPADWPWVAVLANHAGADGRELRALQAAGVQGVVVAGTGHGSLSTPLELALQQARRDGVAVVRGTRCAFGPVLDGAPGSLPAAGERSVWQARVDLLLELLLRPASA